jgi:HPt (histidine-containing phosphotransfer) domain-containing protein
VSVDGRAPGRVLTRSAVATALLPRFLEHRRPDVGTISAALARNDFEAIGTIGHNLSGNGRSYGFPEMSAIGEHLEAAAAVGNAIAVREQLALLEATLAHVNPGGAEEAAPLAPGRDNENR